MILCILLMLLFINIYKKEQIIENTGLIKNSLLLLGCLLIFISFNFNTFSNYVSCSINFILKHSGFYLIYIICLLYITSCYRLGINNNNIENSYLNILQLDDNKKKKALENNNNDNGSFSKTILLNIEKELNNYGSNNSIIKSSNKNERNNKKNENNVEILNKNVLYLHTLHIRMFEYYIVLIIILSVLVIFKNTNEDKYIQEYGNKWYYYCPLVQFDIVINVIELLSLFYLILLNTKIWNYIFIFKRIKYIGYTLVLWITLGPLINVFFFFFLYIYN